MSSAALQRGTAKGKEYVLPLLAGDVFLSGTLAVVPKARYWAQNCLACSSMAWMKGQIPAQQIH